MYLTNDPAKCNTPDNPETSRLLAPHTVGYVMSVLDEYAEETGQELTEDQSDAVIREFENYLGGMDQEVADKIRALADDMLEE